MTEPTIINDETRLVSVDNITPHPQNPNRSDVGRITESILENGFYGTILVQRSTGHILRGNHTYLAAIEAGLSEVPVTYVDVDDERAVRIMVADNRIAEFGERDEEALAELLRDLDGLEGTGFTDQEFADMLAELADSRFGGGGGGSGGGSGEPGGADPNYERKIEAPVYEPTSDTPPEVNELYDDSKTTELIGRIDAAELPEDVRRFLRLAAGRHTVFDYQQIAEFYAHADKETQSLFEDSALVVIDFDKAIESGFVTLVKELAGLYDKDAQEPEPEEEEDEED